jgi:hypothetical protein
MPTLARQIREVLSRCGRPILDAGELPSRVEAILRAIRHLRPFTPSLEAWKATEGLFATPSSSGIVDPRFLEVDAGEDHLYAVVGDLHGDFSAFEEILRRFFPAGMKDDEARRRHLILLGDMLDRGARDLELLQAVLELQVILEDNLLLLSGNHEALYVKDGSPRSEFQPATFLDHYGSLLPAAFFQALADYLAWLPHLAILRFRKGSVAFFHAGVPPEPIQIRAEAAEDYFEVEPARLAFLEGRGPVPGPRPREAHSHRSFYREDLDHFRGHFDVRLLIRGHDVQERGCSVDPEGRFITVFSSGAGLTLDSGYRERASVPHFLVLDGTRLFSEDRAIGERAGLDPGITVQEVFHRDVVLFLASGSPAEGRLMMDLAGRIQEGLERIRDLPVHAVERPGYSVEAEPEVPRRTIRSAPAPRKPDHPGLHPRHTFEISRTYSGALGLREVPPRGSHPPDRNRRQVACREPGEFVEKSIAFIAESLEPKSSD